MSGALSGLAQDGTVDLTFDPGVGPVGTTSYDYVQSIAPQQDGKVVIGGRFTTVDGASRLDIARLNPNGTLDGGFVPATATGDSSIPRLVATQLDGKILFTNSSDPYQDPSELLLRFNADGSRDPGFLYRPVTVGYIIALYVLPDGKLLVLGQGGIERLNPDGGTDPGFTFVGFDDNYSYISALAVQPDGKLVISGVFSKISGVACLNIARLNANGTLDLTFSSPFPASPYTSGNSPAENLVIQPDGKILAAGVSYFLNGQDHLSLCRLNPDGSFDDGFASNSPEGLGFCEAVALQADSKIIAMFGTSVARLNADGTKDDSFAVQSYADSNGTGNINNFALTPSGKILVGGGFTAVNGMTRQHIARLNNTAPSSTAPQLTGPTVAAGTANAPFSYQFTATGTPVSYAVSGLPAGLVIDAATGIITGTPLVPGTFSIVAAATNLVGTGTALFTLTIAAAPVPVPVITSATGGYGRLRYNFIYQIRATNSPVTYFANGLPAGVFVDGRTGLISGVPTTVGTFNVIVGATNAGGTGTANVSVVVTSDSPPAPVITSPTEISATVGQPFAYQITATNFPASYYAYGSDRYELPDGLMVDKYTGLLSGTPAGSTAGTQQVRIEAYSVDSSDEAVLTITISPDPATVPVITSALSASAQVGQPFSYQITATNSPDEFYATGFPGHLDVDETSGLISGTPTIAGTFNVGLSATSDATGASIFSTATLVLTVTTGAFPTPVITSAASANGQAGTAFAYQIVASNNPTSFAATGLPKGLSVNTATGLISGVPATAGSFSVGLSATNATGTGTATLVLTFGVDPAATPPVITSASNVTAAVGQPFDYQITASNNPTGFAVSGLPAGLSLDLASGLISGTLRTTGTYTVNLSAANAGGTGLAILTLNVTADPTVSAPAITSALSVTAQVGEPFTYQITANNSPTSYAANRLPTGLSVETATGLISGTPTAAGTFTVILSATNAGGTGTATLTLMIAPALPTVTLMATTPTVTAGSGNLGVFTLSLSAAQDHDVFVNLTIRGSAINGTEYVLLKTRKKIKAGKTSKPIKVIPLGTGVGTGVKRTVVLTLAPGDGYEVGTAGKVKVKIIGE